MESRIHQSVIITLDTGETFIYIGFSNIQSNDKRKIVSIKFTTPIEDILEEEKWLGYKDEYKENDNE
jgi:hypothetical protein